MIIGAMTYVILFSFNSRFAVADSSFFHRDATRNHYKRYDANFPNHYNRFKFRFAGKIAFRFSATAARKADPSGCQVGQVVPRD